jgi:ribokinase
MAGGRIVVIGGLNMDLHLFGLTESEGQAPIVADQYLASPGGKGGNVSRAISRLGADVSLIGCVGDDEFGRDCVQAVAADGVDVSGVAVTSAAPTGFVAIELVEGRHRSLVFAPGANDLLDVEHVARGLAGLGRGDTVIAQAEIPPAALSVVIEAVSRQGMALYLDPTPPDRVRAGHLAASDVITPDLAEAAALVGRVGESHLWPALAARELVESGARRVVIKLGAEGAIMATPGEPVISVPTLEVEAVDETGAGDVFLAALAVRRSEGATWLDAIAFANAAAAISVSQPGLTLPDRRTVEQERAQAAGPAE